MSNNKLIVLKFGGSVLASEDELPNAIHEIYRRVADGYQVVAVVSALGSTTNELFEKSRKYGNRLPAATVAKLAATGESEGAALLGLAMDRVGIANEVHDETSLGICTAGSVLDASITQVDANKFRQALSRTDVIVVPGFVGRDENLMLNLLGRGGSDLTALCLADALSADDCVLVKDVDGLFEWDPKRSGAPRQFQQITFDNALTLDESIVQHKAIAFARERSVAFEVGSLRSSHSTRVGDFNEDLFYDDRQRPDALRIGLLGMGTVGLGFFQMVDKYPLVKISRIAVRDIDKAVANGASRPIVTNDTGNVVANDVANDGADDVDVIVELMGGTNPALGLVRAALKSGKHVITANKSLIARHGPELNQLAEKNKVQLHYSAAVGGGVPMIEKVQQIASLDRIIEIKGVLNGTCNFVLDKITHDVSFREAVLAAQREGFAEADPSLDLDGTDAAEKLVILARTAGYDICLSQVQRQAIDQQLVDRWQQSNHPHEILRQVSTMTVDADRIHARVEIQALPRNHVFASAHGEDNRLILKSSSGSQTVLAGRGAGRYPTVQAVMNDLGNLIRRQFAGDRRCAVAR